jgi:hypothetical protein
VSSADGRIIPEFDLVIPMPEDVAVPRPDRAAQRLSVPSARHAVRRIYRLKGVKANSNEPTLRPEAHQADPSRRIPFG